MLLINKHYILNSLFTHYLMENTKCILSRTLIFCKFVFILSFSIDKLMPNIIIKYKSYVSNYTDKTLF